MSQRTTIAWTEDTWNPVAGCTVISPGCTNCYAMRRAARLEKQQHGGKYAGLTRKTAAGPVWTGELRLWDRALSDDEVPRRKTPTMIFVNSMSDLAHEDMPVEWFRQVWDVMVATRRERGHIFQVLTKRPENLLRLLKAIGVKDAAPGIWLGVSAEDERRWDERVPVLQDTPTVVPWVSAEPQLARIDRDPSGIAWVVQGGENARQDRARAFDLAWARLMRDRCCAGGTRYFLKQLGTNAIDGGEPVARTDKRDNKRHNPTDWPADLRIREWPSTLESDGGEARTTGGRPRSASDEHAVR